MRRKLPSKFNNDFNNAKLKYQLVSFSSSNVSSYQLLHKTETQNTILFEVCAKFEKPQIHFSVNQRTRAQEDEKQ